MNVLFVCTVNRMRSLTAEKIFAGDARFAARSAGTDKQAATPVSEELIAWADMILVMEDSHRNRLRKKFREVLRNKRILCLNIPDAYDFMDPDLVCLLKASVDGIFGVRPAPPGS